MAPLKVRRPAYDERVDAAYPWLKGHGSIEGSCCCRFGYGAVGRYPWLKGHGSIEGQTAHPSRRGPKGYPWLKGHGSIEGRAPLLFVSIPKEVSMAERSWLH